jgi:hypothetical protein
MDEEQDEKVPTARDQKQRADPWDQPGFLPPGVGSKHEPSAEQKHDPQATDAQCQREETRARENPEQ